MHCAKFCIVLLLFCFQSGSYSRSVSKNQNEVFVYKYKGHIDTTTSASNNTLARWTISGDLHMGRNEREHAIMKLENVKTSVFNGPESQLEDVEEKQIPNEAKIIEQQFVVTFNSENNYFPVFQFKENEPLWSINMKRGLFNFIQFSYEIPKTIDGKFEPIKPETYSEEDSMYGKCMEYYVRKSTSVEDEVVFERRMDGLNCTDRPIQHIANVGRAPGITDLSDLIDYKSTKVCTLKKKDDYYIAHEQVLKTTMEYKTTSNEPYSQIIDQEQSIVFSNSYITNEAVDLSEYSVNKEITYEISDDRTSGRHVEEKSQSELVTYFLQHYDKYVEKLSYKPPEDINIRNEDPVYEMFEALRKFDANGFEELRQKIIANRTNRETLIYTYFPLLTYIGTEVTADYLINFMQTQDIDILDDLAHKILSTFPKYILNPTEEMLVKMEPFLNLQNVKSQQLKTAGVLSFASTVDNACQENAISKKYKTKYSELLRNKYLEGNDYEEKMKYLLGLINMGSCLDADFINSITTNTSESRHLRALAFVGFKEHLKDYKQVYETYWPIVQKKSEPFEIRVRALDLLLASNLNDDQFNSIVSKYSGSIENSEEKQLANYVLSSLHSITNTFGYNDNLEALASEALKNNKIQTHPKILASGHYRLSYTNSELNIGSTFDIRLINDPQTNALDTIQITYNSYGNSFDFGTYTLYLKFSGLLDAEIIENIFNKLIDVESIPELVKLLKEYNFEIKSYTSKYLVDLVLFIDNTVVYSLHYNDTDDIIVYLERFKRLLETIENIWFPVLDYIHIPSDFGTPIEISTYMQDITKYDYTRLVDLHYRSSSSFETWLELYNPLLDTYTSSYKYHIDEMNINLYNVSINSVVPLSLNWTNDIDSYAEVWDNSMGTKAEENVLKEYCPKCDAYNKVTSGDVRSRTNTFEALGFNVVISTNNFTKYMENAHQFISNGLHDYDIDAMPFAGPILYFLNIYNYNFWLDSDLTTGYATSRPINGCNKTETSLDLSIKNTNYGKLFGKESKFDFCLNTIVVDPEDNSLLNSVDLRILFESYVNPDMPHSTKENIKNKIVQMLQFDLTYNTTYSDDSFKITANGDLVYPPRQSDRLYMLPFERITGESTIIFAKYNEDVADFVPRYTVTLKDVLSSNNKEEIIESEHLKSEYEKCSADSKGLKFTAPTEECKKVSSRLTEYNKYQLYIKAEKHTNGTSEIITNMSEPWLDIHRIDEDYVSVKIADLEFAALPKDVNNTYKVYYPNLLVDPVALAYNNEDSKVLLDARSTCTITPSKIEQFYGKHIPNQKNEWLAFVECYNTSIAGLKGRTIDDKHVGFTFYSYDNVVEATVKDGKAYVTLNGKHINEFYTDGEEYVRLRIHFLADDVVIIMNYNTEIYYNTEYIAATVNSIYPKILCGVCTQ